MNTANITIKGAITIRQYEKCFFFLASLIAYWYSDCSPIQKQLDEMYLIHQPVLLERFLSFFLRVLFFLLYSLKYSFLNPDHIIQAILVAFLPAIYNNLSTNSCVQYIHISLTKMPSLFGRKTLTEESTQLCQLNFIKKKSTLRCHEFPIRKICLLPIGNVQQREVDFFYLEL